MEQPLSQLSPKLIGDFLIWKAGVPTAYKVSVRMVVWPSACVIEVKVEKSKAPREKSAQYAICLTLIQKGLMR